jgi:hypothetical protein
MLESERRWRYDRLALSGRNSLALCRGWGSLAFGRGSLALDGGWGCLTFGRRRLALGGGRRSLAFSALRLVCVPWQDCR